MTKLHLLILLGGLLMFPVHAFSADRSIVPDASGEYAFLTGYGITHRGFGDTRTQVETFDMILRYGRFLSDEVGKGHWYQGRHELFLELPYHLALDHGGRSMVGGYILGSWKFTAPEQLVPYVFAGGGILFVDLGLPTMGTRLDFSYQGVPASSILSGKTWRSWPNTATTTSPTPALPNPTNPSIQANS